VLDRETNEPSSFHPHIRKIDKNDFAASSNAREFGMNIIQDIFFDAYPKHFIKVHGYGSAIEEDGQW
jgi:hypothetical protein